MKSLKIIFESKQYSASRLLTIANWKCVDLHSVSSEMLVELISTVVWCRMSRSGIRSHGNRVPAPKFPELSYWNIVNCQCRHCVHSSDADSCHIHSFPIWIDFSVHCVCPRSACNSVVVLRSVVCVLQTILPPDSNGVFQSSNDPTVGFVCRNCAGSPTGHSWQKRNFYFSVNRKFVLAFSAYFGLVGLFRNVLLVDDPNAGFEIVFLIRL